MSKSPQHDRNRRASKALGVKWSSPVDRAMIRQLRREQEAAKRERERALRERPEARMP